MNFDGIIADLKANKLAGRAYERVGAPGNFRDRVTVYRDGKLLFERFCYGEAAGRVCTCLFYTSPWRPLHPRTSRR